MFYMLYTFGPYKNVGNIEVIPYKTANEINEPNARTTESRSKRPLYIFDSVRFEEVKDHDVQAPNTCVRSGLEV